jgi:hypothetical protein
MISMNYWWAGLEFAMWVMRGGEEDVIQSEWQWMVSE